PAAPRAADPAPRAAAPETSDWREALRATGAKPVSESPRAEPAPPSPADPAPVGAADLPPGLVVAKPTAPGVTDIDAAPSLDVLADMVRRCTRCTLHQTAIQGVPGEGNPNARFVVVGEAPGATEDETGRPFVGAAGQLLTKILAAINLRREDVFICNVIKHRPPGNRNPLPNEIAACSPYLIRQLELIRPGVILALGTFAAQTLLETKESIGKLRGRVHRYHGIPLIVTYHPAALLRNPAWKRPTWDDVQLARRILDSSPDDRA
ncbi:MAG TPA: uracil-DNA glycosylase, partial [Gemmatimonadaceae bacterium]|nr:uracil-DNA glycosylase [Gemmatimonadaceae bacterium]